MRALENILRLQDLMNIHLVRLEKIHGVLIRHTDIFKSDHFIADRRPGRPAKLIFQDPQKVRDHICALRTAFLHIEDDQHIVVHLV